MCGGDDAQRAVVCPRRVKVSKHIILFCEGKSFIMVFFVKKYGKKIWCQPGEMPSPEKARKSVRVEENNEEEDQVFDAPYAQDEAV